MNDIDYDTSVFIGKTKARARGIDNRRRENQHFRGVNTYTYFYSVYTCIL